MRSYKTANETSDPFPSNACAAVLVRSEMRSPRRTRFFFFCVFANYTPVNNNLACTRSHAMKRQSHRDSTDNRPRRVGRSRGACFPRGFDTSVWYGDARAYWTRSALRLAACFVRAVPAKSQKYILPIFTQTYSLIIHNTRT